MSNLPERIDNTTEVGGLLHLAVDKGVPVETLERIAALYREHQEREAAREFAADFAEFQQSCPPIQKSSTARVQTKSGTYYEYRYAELDEIARTIGPHLHSRGFSYSWDSSEQDGRITCICTLRHANGHHVSATFSAPVDGSPAMSAQQKAAGTLTYARRQSLVQALGLTTTEDTDGSAEAARADITDEQAQIIEALIVEVGADRDRFLAYLKVDDVPSIPQSLYRHAKQALENRRKKP